MPVLRFHLLTIDHEMVEGGFTVTITTNAACHLYLRYSDVFPRIHRKTVQRRGLAMGWDARYCFVAYHHIEQNEESDTFTHTFTWPGWSDCETRYFYFWGTMGGQDMVSDTPIFWLHYLWEAPPEPDLICHFVSDCSLGDRVRRLYHWSTGFIPVANYALSYIEMNLGRKESPATITCYIKAADVDHKPTGPILSSGTTPGNSLPLWPLYEERTLILSPFTVLEGIEYRICLMAPDAETSSSYCYWPKENGFFEPCLQKRTWGSNDGGVIWWLGEYPQGYDFRIYGTLA